MLAAKAAPGNSVSAVTLHVMTRSMANNLSCSAVQAGGGRALSVGVERCFRRSLRSFRYPVIRCAAQVPDQFDVAPCQADDPDGTAPRYRRIGHRPGGGLSASRRVR